jgi:hypothetical protein
LKKKKKNLLALCILLSSPCRIPNGKKLAARTRKPSYEKKKKKNLGSEGVTKYNVL